MSLSITTALSARVIPPMVVRRGRFADSFHSSLGMIITPHQALRSTDEAVRFSQKLEGLEISQYMEVKTAKGENLQLVEMGENLSHMIFKPASGDEFAGLKDAIECKPKAAELIRRIEIKDEIVRQYVEKKCQSKIAKGSHVVLIYHNYINPTTKAKKLKADALIYLFQQQTSLLGNRPLMLFCTKSPVQK
jgi:hypothetical protein